MGKLGLDAVVGGKLIPARNMALDDAEKMGKACVQCSDDIEKWQYVDEQGGWSKKKSLMGSNAAGRVCVCVCVCVCEVPSIPSRCCQIHPRQGARPSEETTAGGSLTPS